MTDTISHGATKSSVLEEIERWVVDAGVSPDAFMGSLNDDLNRVADRRRALNNLHRFLVNGFTSSLVRDFAAHRALQQIALELFAQSQFLSDILVRDPELFRWLTATPALSVQKDRGQFIAEASSAVTPFGRTEKKLDALKRFHRRELLRIGGREILRRAEIPEITAELSWLADAILSATLHVVIDQIHERSVLDLPKGIAIIGLGKLGGEELNFSSDIDLLFVYESDGDVDFPEERIHTLHQYYNRIGERVVRALTESSGEGHLYRVDMRLRPDGAAGSLAMSRQAYRQYYETRGEVWERQMLIKARVVAGDADVGKRWMQEIVPFVHPKTVLGSPFDEIRDIKKKIESRISSRENIKLGSGGIRDIEFIVQALQMLWGGPGESLRENNTLRALAALANAGRVSQKEEVALRNAYLFLRTVEHRLQLLHGLQTHSLPTDRQEMEFLTRRLGFATPSEFRSILNNHRDAVRQVFHSVFGSAKRSSAKEVPATTEDESLLDSLTRLDAGDRFDRIHSLLNDLGEPRFTIRNFRSLLQSSLIERDLKIAVRNNAFVEFLILICARSKNLTAHLAKEPLLFETFMSQPSMMFGKVMGWESLEHHDRRRFKEYNEFRISLRFLLNKISVEEMGKELSVMADHFVMKSFDESCKSVPRRTLPPMCLIALGRLGGKELSIGSDLDLLFLYQEKASDDAAVAEKIVKEFLSRTSGEGLYEIDMRLRPEGKNAPLAVEIEYYKSYLDDRASLWEWQLLTRGRVVAGDKKLERSFNRLRNSILGSQQLPKGWHREIVAMRKKIQEERVKESNMSVDLKLDRGGLADIEFAVQAMQLKFGAKGGRLRKQSVFDVLKDLSKRKLLPKREVVKMMENYEFLRVMETMARLNNERGSSNLPKEREAFEMLVHVAGEQSIGNLQARIRRVRAENRRFFLSVLRSEKG